MGAEFGGLLRGYLVLNGRFSRPDLPAFQAVTFTNQGLQPAPNGKASSKCKARPQTNSDPPLPRRPRSKGLFWKDVEDTVLCAACAPPGGGRQEVTPRWARPHQNGVWR